MFSYIRRSYGPYWDLHSFPLHVTRFSILLSHDYNGLVRSYTDVQQ